MVINANEATERIELIGCLLAYLLACLLACETIKIDNSFSTKYSFVNNKKKATRTEWKKSEPIVDLNKQKKSERKIDIK